MAAESPELSAQERAGKAFPVSWDQFHRDCRGVDLAAERGRSRLSRRHCDHLAAGLVPAAIVARELGVSHSRSITVWQSPVYDHTKQGELKVLKGISPDTRRNSAAAPARDC